MLQHLCGGIHLFCSPSASLFPLAMVVGGGTRAADIGRRYQNGECERDLCPLTQHRLCVSDFSSPKVPLHVQQVHNLCSELFRTLSRRAGPSALTWSYYAKPHVSEAYAGGDYPSSRKWDLWLSRDGYHVRATW